MSTLTDKRRLELREEIVMTGHLRRKVGMYEPTGIDREGVWRSTKSTNREDWKK